MADAIRDAESGIRPSSGGHSPIPKFRIPAVAIATALGVGYVPVAPGTFGSAMGLLLWGVLPSTTIVQATVMPGAPGNGWRSSGISVMDSRVTR